MHCKHWWDGLLEACRDCGMSVKEYRMQALYGTPIAPSNAATVGTGQQVYIGALPPLADLSSCDCGQLIHKSLQQCMDCFARTQTKTCTHEWKHYVGLTQSFDYCTKCDKKR